MNTKDDNHKLLTTDEAYAEMVDRLGEAFALKPVTLQRWAAT